MFRFMFKVKAKDDMDRTTLQPQETPMKRPYRSKTVLAQLLLVAGTLSFEEIDKIICENPSLSATIWAAITIFLRCNRSNISLRKGQRRLKLIHNRRR